MFRRRRKEIVPWSPFDDIERYFEDIRADFEDFMRERWGISEVRMPTADIMETDSEVIVKAEVPGMRKKDLNIEISEDALEVSGEVKREEEEKAKNFLRRERYHTRYYRRFALPEGVDIDRAEATLKDGVLTVRLPKKEEEKRRRLKIEIK